MCVIVDSQLFAVGNYPFKGKVMRHKLSILLDVSVSFGCKTVQILFVCMTMEDAGFWRKVLQIKNPFTC